MEYSGADAVTEYSLYMMPGSKGLNPHELAHKWMKNLGTRPQYEHKSGMVIPRYANIWGIVGVRSTKQSAGIIKHLYSKDARVQRSDRHLNQGAEL